MRLRVRKRSLVISFLAGSLLAIAIYPVAAYFLAAPHVKLHPLVGDNMVLQRGMEVPVWGWATAGKKVTVEFRGQKKRATARQDGRWMIKLAPMEAGGPFEMEVAGRSTITLQNVCVGEVWLGSGQSNMRWPVAASLDAEKETAQADHPDIRLFTVKPTHAKSPAEDCEGSWKVCDPKTVRPFSGLAYFFGREIQQYLNVPVGLIVSAVDSTPAGAWMSMETLTSDPFFRNSLPYWERVLRKNAEMIREYENKLAQWPQDAEKAKAEGREVAPKPIRPMDARLQAPSRLFNGMITPLIPYAIKGVIWHQGEYEAETGGGATYRKILPALIQGWRREWGQGDFPFLFVQLANYHKPELYPAKSGWALSRESQLLTMLSVPNTGMAVSIDIGEADRIHPKNKQEMGRRLALMALGVAYKKPIAHSGPICKSAAIGGHKIRIKFYYVFGGLVAKGGGPLKGFSVAGPGGRFVPAQAKIEGNEVVVWNDAVKIPLRVRYAWADNPQGSNLYNEAGLPASPFRIGKRLTRPPSSTPGSKPKRNP